MNKPSILIIEDDKAVKISSPPPWRCTITIIYGRIRENRASCPLLPRDLTSSYWTWGFRTWTEWT